MNIVIYHQKAEGSAQIVPVVDQLRAAAAQENKRLNMLWKQLHVS